MTRLLLQSKNLDDIRTVDSSNLSDLRISYSVLCQRLTGSCLDNMPAKKKRQNCLKAVAVGHGRVGKSSLCNRFINSTFPEVYAHTLHCDIRSTEVEINDEAYKLFLYDIGGGGERFHTIRPCYYRGADVFLLLFDVSDSRLRFEDIYSYWWPELRKKCEDVPIILVGSKIDLRFSIDTAITRSEGEAMAERIEAVKYMEISSLRDDGVTELFHEVQKIGHHFSCTVKNNNIEERKGEKSKCIIA